MPLTRRQHVAQRFEGDGPLQNATFTSFQEVKVPCVGSYGAGSVVCGCAEVMDVHAEAVERRCWAGASWWARDGRCGGRGADREEAWPQRRCEGREKADPQLRPGGGMSEGREGEWRPSDLLVPLTRRQHVAWRFEGDGPLQNATFTS